MDQAEAGVQQCAGMRRTATRRGPLLAMAALLLTPMAAVAQPPPGPPGLGGPPGPGGPPMQISREHIADAKPGDIRVLASGAMENPLEKLRAEAQKAVGQPLVIEYGSARGGLRDQALGGAQFEVALLVPDVNEQLVAAGKAKPGAYDIGQVAIAMGVRGDPPADLDVSTREGVKKVLLGAKGVRYAATGMALPTVKKVIAELQLEGKINDRSAARDQLTLGPGEYEVSINPASEIIQNKSLKNLGPVTASLQAPGVIQAVIGASSKDDEAARRLIRFLQGDAMAEVLKANGYERPKSAPSK